MNSIKNWPAQSREAARRVIEQYGEPDEISDGQLVWHKRGPWRQIVASKACEQANFPAPHYTLFALEPSEESATMVAAKAIKRKVRKSAVALGKIAGGTPPATSAA
ncbi:MAG: hypothetical protein ABSC72_11995 [Methylovirgula sp.]|jgi:hypothetical protein